MVKHEPGPHKPFTFSCDGRSSPIRRFLPPETPSDLVGARGLEPPTSAV